MGRPKEFNTTDVVDRAMLLFWKKGYEASSIEDLTEATGIKRGSLYGAFRDKEGLFLAALQRYSETLVNSMIMDLNDPDPRRAIEGLFETILQRTNRPGLPPGCLITNTLLECRRGQDRITRAIGHSLGQLELAIYAVLCRAKSEGSLATTSDPKVLAHFFFGVVQSLNVMSNPAMSPEVRKNTVKVALDAWRDYPERDTGSRARKRGASSDSRPPAPAKGHNQPLR
jgi:TetR/AcrR family transcriptional regulator, transcriptional repressor for nem operon